MNAGELGKTFDRDGYVVVEDFFAPELMDRIDGVIRGYYGDNPDFWHNDEFLEKSYTEVVPWFPQREGN
ncbi:MAG: phytanoyl-CoA dioxygenase, partial [Proteobacteria bacterium]|nr:phytanoyl-CoA dioxygenase [Pseudomonadota bacterium]